MSFDPFGIFSDLGIGGKGSSWEASGVPGMPGSQQIVSPGQLSGAYNQSQQGMQDQQNFLGALGRQNGIGNQSNVFGRQGTLAGDLETQLNGQNALGAQQNFLGALQGGMGLQNQATLGNMLTQQAQGGGPNPAAAMLAQNTGQNVAQQAALMGSARGAGANPGLIARQAAMQGGAMQQQATGQAAVMKAQQQLAAQQQLGQLGAQQVNQQQAGLGQYGQQQLGTQQALMAQQAAMGNLATAQVGQQSQAMNARNQAAQNYQNMLMSGANQQNAQNVGMQSNINSANAGINQQVTSNQGALLGGILGGTGASMMGGGGGGGMGSMAGMAMMAAEGGIIPEMPQQTPLSILGQYSQDFQGTGGIPDAHQNVELYSPHISSTPDFSKGAQSAGKTAGGATDDINKVDLDSIAVSKGGRVPGKAKVKGDSYSNDTVSAKLSPGEIVIPRSHSGDPNKIAAFLNGLLGTKLRAA